MFGRLHSLLASSFLLGVTGLATAQYVAINVHPAGSYGASELRAAHGGQQVGFGYEPVNSDQRALIWSSTPASASSIHPGTHFQSAANATDGTRQVGMAILNQGGPMHAAMWSGSPGTFVDLHPAGYEISEAWEVSGNVQVGRAILSGPGQIDRAAMWMGTAASFTSLHPASGYWRSWAHAIDGGFQYGWAAPDNMNPHAARWSGSAASMVEFHPSTGFISSFIQDAHGGQQIGYGLNESSQPRALLWSGTPGSYIELHPAGHSQSFGVGVANGKQVGLVMVGGQQHAALWSGTAASWVDLHTLLPAQYTSSVAWDVDPVTGDIVGMAQTSSGGAEAFIWRPVPEPASMAALAAGVLLVARKRRHR